ncbi:hypothetical protein [Ramlibacter sp.]|uniref:hypothetical protein n=1 Tax=Ramlibacter sp. TaxID=1917967 RepID=UPI003D14A046
MDPGRKRFRTGIVVAATLVVVVMAVLAAVKTQERKPARTAVPAVAAVPQTPVPPPQEVDGATSAELTLAPQAGPLKVDLAAISDARLEPGGSIEIDVFANGQKCNGKRYPREANQGPGYTLSMACNDVALQPGVAHTFRATLSVDKGTAKSFKLRANYHH